jgi:hypothetical protein
MTDKDMQLYVDLSLPLRAAFDACRQENRELRERLSCPPVVAKPDLERMLWEVHLPSRRMLQGVAPYLEPHLLPGRYASKIVEKVWELMIEARLRELEEMGK